eukprot:TRINITY_DN47013_c0_g1_i1.p1 TRINITY_DN47013_c0_g1~~TRINITY_DN47013_c0_g1_i1.p1  ORF type:complete len:407 (+),score=130.78 TRINITY_DN47013_c0_g1_i1:61-1281(+)
MRRRVRECLCRCLDAPVPRLQHNRGTWAAWRWCASAAADTLPSQLHDAFGELLDEHRPPPLGATGPPSASAASVAESLRREHALRKAVVGAITESGRSLDEASDLCESLAESLQGTVTLAAFERRLLRVAPEIQRNWPVLRAEEHQQEEGEDGDTELIDRVPHQYIQSPMKREILIPPADSDYPLTVVLDIDETLLHSYFPNRRIKYRSLANGTAPKVTARSHRFDLGDDFYVTLRPGATDLIRWLHEQGVEVILWTAGSELYAGTITSELFPLDCVHHTIFRDDRWFDEETVSSALKYLEQLGRPLDRTIIIENNPYVCTANIDNAVVVKDYFEGDKDPTLDVVREVISDALFRASLGESVRDIIPGHQLLTKRLLPRRDSTDDPDHFMRKNPPHFWAVPPPQAA